MASSKKQVTSDKKNPKKAQKTVTKTVKKEVENGNNKEINKTENGAAEEKQAAEVKIAKAGRRSAKALKETEEKAKKEERKASSTETKPKLAQKPPRSRLERRGKKYREISKLIEKGKKYELSEAIELAKKTSATKFDATVELHIRLNIDPKQSDQNVRGTVVLPAGTGKTVRVAVFAEQDKLDGAKKAGADIAGEDDFLNQLAKEKLDFDILISTPASMPKLARFAKLLGPKGLMPSPKNGTVTNKVAEAVKAAKQGMQEFRADPTGIVHMSVGKVSFEPSKLNSNISAAVDAIKQARPASVKGDYVLSTHLTTSMGPSIKLSA